MNKLNISFTSSRLMQKLTTYLAATATVAMVTLAASVWLSRANASAQQESREGGRHEVELLLAIYNEAQVAELDQLLADFHGDLSYGGNLTAMMSLWAQNSSLTFNGTANNGKAAVQTFFANGGPFHNNWVSLAPEYKTQITVHGDTADFITQCVFIDLSVTPNPVKSVVEVTGTAVKFGGNWIFKSMNNTSPATL
jgi:hypothetical protein